MHLHCGKGTTRRSGRRRQSVLRYRPSLTECLGRQRAHIVQIGEVLLSEQSSTKKKAQCWAFHRINVSSPLETCFIKRLDPSLASAPRCPSYYGNHRNLRTYRGLGTGVRTKKGGFPHDSIDYRTGIGVSEHPCPETSICAIGKAVAILPVSSTLHWKAR